MNDDKRISRLNELLPQLNQQEKMGIIAEIAFPLQNVKDPRNDIEKEILTICDEFEDDSSAVSTIQSLANSLVK